MPTKTDKKSNGESSVRAGFEESPAVFDGAATEHASPDAIRFAQTVALTRTFNLIEAPADREQVVALARRLAGAQDG